MLPFQSDDEPAFEPGDWIFVPGVREAIATGKSEFTGHIIRDGKVAGTMALYTAPLTDDERQIILDGCLINYNRRN